MIVQCPNCDTKFRLDESLVGQDGAQVRCSRCSHVFRVNPPLADDDGIDVVKDSEFDWLKDMDIEEDVEAKSKSPLEESISGPLYEKKDGDISLEIQPSKPARSKAVNWVIAGIAVFSLTLGVLLYFPELQTRIGSWFISEKMEHVVEPVEVLGEDQVNQISLQNVRQYFVTNEKIGQLFVIEGKARNDFTLPMELIKIEASLFDGLGELVERQQWLAGNTVNLFQLQILSEEELQAALQANVGILANNTNLRPGMDVPFMVVFPNPPETVQEYGLKVVEARRPPQ